MQGRDWRWPSSQIEAQRVPRMLRVDNGLASGPGIFDLLFLSAFSSSLRVPRMRVLARLELTSSLGSHGTRVCCSGTPAGTRRVGREGGRASCNLESTKASAERNRWRRQVRSYGVRLGSYAAARRQARASNSVAWAVPQQLALLVGWPCCSQGAPRALPHPYLCQQCDRVNLVEPC
jgi:hypothetical protein